MIMRQLRGTRRLVPLYDLDEYLAGWKELQAAFIAAGGRAWIFRAASRQDQFLEFLEARDLATLLAEPEIAAALEALEVVFGEGVFEEWEEVQTA
jgi:hypothetical protein